MDNKNDDWVAVASEVHMKRMKMLKKSINSRVIIIIFSENQNKLYAMDGICYHAGGPLWKGDIEDIGNNCIIKCPWHSYRIIAKSGEGIYMGLDKKWHMKPGGCKQRTHNIRVNDGVVEVQLTYDGEIESDGYAYHQIHPK